MPSTPATLDARSALGEAVKHAAALVDTLPASSEWDRLVEAAAGA